MSIGYPEECVAWEYPRISMPLDDELLLFFDEQHPLELDVEPGVWGVGTIEDGEPLLAHEAVWELFEADGGYSSNFYTAYNLGRENLDVSEGFDGRFMHALNPSRYDADVFREWVREERESWIEGVGFKIDGVAPGCELQTLEDKDTNLIVGVLLPYYT